MTKVNHKKQLIKDLTTVSLLGGLLIALPFAKDSKGSVTSMDEDLADNKEFIESVFPQVSHWNYAAVEVYFSEQTITANGDEIEAVFDVLSSTLGSLESFAEPKQIEVDASAFSTSELWELQVFEFNAVYEYGNAEIEIILADNKDEAEIFAMNVSIL